MVDLKFMNATPSTFDLKNNINLAKSLQNLNYFQVFLNENVTFNRKG